jgi:hypothetical protein
VYTVEVALEGRASVTRLVAPIQKVDFEFAAGDLNPLAYSGCQFRLASALAYQLHRVEILARPQKSLAELMAAVAQVGEPTIVDVFGLSPDEPFRTFRNIWTQCPELPLRVGALVCAMTYRAEAVRNGQG